MSTADLHLLRPAIEAALGVARRGEADDPPVPAPPLLRPFLSFARLPGAALAVARRVVDDDDAFRVRVRAAICEADVGPLGWLWLDRPEGWQVALAEAAAASADARGSGDENDAGNQRRHGRRSTVGQAAEGRAGVRARRAVEELERLRAEASELRRANRRLAGELGQTEAQVVALAEDRTRAVRQLKAVEASLAERVAESRRYRQEAETARRRLTEALGKGVQAAPGRSTTEGPAPLAPSPAGSAGPPGSAPEVDLPRAARTVAQAADAAGRLGAALADLATVLRHGSAPAEVTEAIDSAEPGPPVTPLPPLAETHLPATGPPDSAADRAADETSEADRWPPRRRPVRLARGAADDTPPGADGLARLPNVVFLVDGYNVSKTAWPDLALGAQRLRLVNAVAELRVRLGTQIELVFDGNAEGQALTRALPTAVRVWFSPEGLEADDLILALVDRQPPERPVVVVSSDRRVQDGAGRRGASVLSSPTFLCLLR